MCLAASIKVAREVLPTILTPDMSYPDFAAPTRICQRKKKRSRESAEGAVAFTVKTYGRMDALVNGAAGNFLANAHELKLKVGRLVGWLVLCLFVRSVAYFVC